MRVYPLPSFDERRASGLRWSSLPPSRHRSEPPETTGVRLALLNAVLPPLTRLPPPPPVGRTTSGEDVEVALDDDDFVEVDLAELDDTRVVSEGRDPGDIRYVVHAGRARGELVLRALAPGEPPPFDAPIAKIAPSCGLDARSIAMLLRG